MKRCHPHTRVSTHFMRVTLGDSPRTIHALLNSTCVASEKNPKGTYVLFTIKRAFFDHFTPFHRTYRCG
jgi:hypothetical protein